MRRLLPILLLISTLQSACAPWLWGERPVPIDRDNLEVFVSSGDTLTVSAFNTHFSIVLAGDHALDTQGVVVTVIDLGAGFLLETADPKGRYLPSAQIVPRDAEPEEEIHIQQIDAKAVWSIQRTNVIRLRSLQERFLKTTPLGFLGEVISDNTIGKGANILLQVPDSLEDFRDVSIYRTPGTMTFLVLPSRTQATTGAALLSTVEPGGIRLATISLMVDTLETIKPARLVEEAQSLSMQETLAQAQVKTPPPPTPTNLPTPECPQGQQPELHEENGETVAQCVPVEATQTAQLPTGTPAAETSPTPTVKLPTPTPTPTEPPVVYTETFREVDPLLLGDCSRAVHDRFIARGPDGQTYRTWHPITAQIDPADPEGPTCSFAHEHGDPPHPDAPLPYFGYLAYQADQSELIDRHEGYKVFTHLRGQVTGWGTEERVSINPDLDSQFWMHQGTAHRSRLTQRFHDAGFWSRDAAGNRTEIYYFADTGQLADKCNGVNQSGRARYLASECDYGNETWDYAVSIGGAWSTTVRVQVANPMRYMRGDTENPAAITLLSPSEVICGVNFFPCAYKLPFGHKNSIWLGNMRMLTTPDWQWNNRSGEEFFCTDVYGNRVDDSLCSADERGHIQQQVPGVDFYGGKSQVWDRTSAALGDLLRLPLGAPGGN